MEPRPPNLPEVPAAMLLPIEALDGLEPLALDLKRIREPKEVKLRRRCGVALGACLVLGIGLSLGALALWLAVSLMAAGLLEQRFRGTAARAGPDQFPGLYHATQKAARLLDIDLPVETFVTCKPGGLDAYTLKLKGRYAVVVHANWVSMLEQEELEYVMAHQLAHVKAGHLGPLALVYVIRSAPPVLRLLAAPLEVYRYLYSPWSRKAEITADRLALEATGLNLDAAVSCLAKIAVGEELAHVVNPKAFAQQAQTVRFNWYLLANELVTDGPLPVRRVRLLEEYLETRPEGGYLPPPKGLIGRLLDGIAGLLGSSESEEKAGILALPPADKKGAMPLPPTDENDAAPLPTGKDSDSPVH